MVTLVEVMAASLPRLALARLPVVLQVRAKAARVERLPAPRPEGWADLQVRHSLAAVLSLLVAALAVGTS